MSRSELFVIFDADDTLWENNVYFERAIGEFCELIAPFASDAQAIRRVLDAVEKVRIPRYGYGTQNFLDGLRDTFRHFYAANDGVAYLQEIECIGNRLLNHPMQLLPGVAETLDNLRLRCRLLLFTKGDQQEQTGKLARSGLRDYFDAVEIVPEKDANAYRDLSRRQAFRENAAFMVGNSPRSDIRPALEAGLWAVFVPHPNTWDFEDGPVEPHPRLLHAESVQQLPSLLDRWQAAAKVKSQVSNA